jgi:hypothetical protein
MGKDAEPKPIGFFVEQALDRIAGGDPRPTIPSGRATSRRYRLELVATGTDEEATRKLRAMLKLALRGFGLRCVEAVEIRDEEAPPRRVSNDLLTTCTDCGFERPDP